MTNARAGILRQSRLRVLIGVLLPLAGVCVLPAASAAGQAPAHWATVNICNTPRGSYHFGVRGQMSGRQNGGGLYMQFTAQYYQGSNGSWHSVGGNATSPWQHARDRGLGWSEQMGYQWTMMPPAKGETYVLRGFVEFQWRSGSHVIATAYASTSGGHPDDHGDPAKYSKAQCTMTLVSTSHADATARTSSGAPAASTSR